MDKEHTYYVVVKDTNVRASVSWNDRTPFMAKTIDAAQKMADVETKNDDDGRKRTYVPISIADYEESFCCCEEEGVKEQAQSE